MRETPQNPKVLILGGGYAGMMAAARVARETRQAEITLIDQNPVFVQRIRLHEILAGRRPATLEYAPLLAKRGLRFLQARVESLDLAARRVAVREPNGARRQIPYDSLILALGSTTAAGVPGVAEHTVRLDVPATLGQTHERLRQLASTGGRVVVAGGGLTGIETATEVAERFPALRVTLATRGKLGDGYSPTGAAHLRQRFTALGIELREDVDITAVQAGRIEISHESGGDESGGDESGGTSPGELPFDLCLWCGGFVAPPLARQAGLPVDGVGRVLTDAAQRAPGHPEVFVAGDAAAPWSDGPFAIRMSCASALPGGAQAGENVARFLRGEEPLPYSMAFGLRCISLGRKEALVQFVTGDDRPLPKIWTGRRAVWVKELICRMTLFVVRWEVRSSWRLYPWSRPIPRLVDSPGAPEKKVAAASRAVG
ncbi:MAG TPA: FAD-dependent oxidoreductase [Thermoanaerobaculia bacterium]|nr:FAD-dependent oxidoreductase [Thermoanaerobaculia bacterium]